MKMMIAFILLFGIVAGFYSNSELVQRNDLEDIKELTEKNNVEVKSWMALSRSKIGHAHDVKDMKMKMENFMSNHDSYSWKRILEEKNSHYVWQGQKENEHGIIESIKLKAYKSGGKYEISITSEAKGKLLTAKRIKWVNETFKNNNTFYTISGVMKFKGSQLDKVAEKMVKDMDAKVVEQLQENSFISVSAYSKALESELMTAKQEKMNLQIGLRADVKNNKLEVTIGTPIITTEY